MPMPKPRRLDASPEVLAQVTDKLEKLLDALSAQTSTEDSTSTREAILDLFKGLAGRATYRVYVNTVEESHRITYWTTIVSSNRAMNGRDWNKGYITPFMSETLEHAEYEAASWAAFLGVDAEPWVKPDWHDALAEKFAARALETGKGSGSVPAVGCRLEASAEEEAALLAASGRTHQG